MKKFKKAPLIVTFLIVITLILIFGLNVFGYNYLTTGSVKWSELSYYLSGGTNSHKFKITYGMLCSYDNIYCVQHGNYFPETQVYHSLRAKVEIDGDEAKFTQYEDYNKNKDNTVVKTGTVVNEANNILAAILSESDMELGHKKGKQKYCGSQIALYNYWDTWSNLVGAKNYGIFDEWNHNADIVKEVEEDVVTELMNKANLYASKYKYNATIYYFNFFWDGETPSVQTTGQSIILVEREEPEDKEEPIDLTVKKSWVGDDKNEYGNQTDSITVYLTNKDTGENISGEGITNPVILNKSNNWTYKFENLDKDINYWVKEVSVSGYKTNISGNNNGILITNTLETTKINVTKKWVDENNYDGKRPESIQVELYEQQDNGELISAGKTITLTGKDNTWTGSFINLPKYRNGKLIKYVIKENEVVIVENGYTAEYTNNGTSNVTITNKYIPGYLEITGKVWLDRADGKANKINGTLDEDESGLGGIKVTLKDVNGNQFDATATTTTNDDGTYTIRVNYDNSQNVYKLYEDVGKVRTKLKTAYIEFEYDAMKYTTVATAATGTNTSKAIENETTRNNFDNVHSTVTTSTSNPDKWTDKTITAITKDVIAFETYADKTSIKREEVIKYCTGSKTEQTNPNRAWENIVTTNKSCGSCNGTAHTVKTFNIDVEIITNVNLGLFEREQPKVGIYSDLSKVVVEMNKQKYTYLYGVRSKDFANADIKTQFQNKDEYKYERPVNPADISCIQEEINSDAMNIFVTYEIEVGNLSTTLPITVNNIINVYDLDYKEPTITIDGNTITYTSSEIYGKKSERGFNEITLNNLGLTIQPEKRSSKIVMTYEVEKSQIKSIFEGNAALHNAVEIHTHSTTYGESTLYAEQKTGGRTGQSYAGYDNETHPGNAAIRKELVTYTDKENKAYQTEILKSTENLVEYVAGKFGPERDTDISPSFILCKANPKTLSGTVFEDTDSVTTDSERLGDGKYDSATEKTVENVQVELYKIVRDSGNNITGVELAELHKDPTITETGEYKVTKVPARVYSDSNGNYAFDGVVTGEYFIKFTYGNDTTKTQDDGTKELEYATTMDGGASTINARNHKSTIITNPDMKELFKLDYEDSNFDKKWHVNIEDNYSIAVDHMKDRLEIEDLQSSNFYAGENMTAYSKPFISLIEFESTGGREADAEGNIADLNGNTISNSLSKLDFGIIERPREDIFAQKVVTHIKITLSNGQILTEGDPRTETLNYVKAMGQGQIFEDSAKARDFDRRLLVEMDTQLIQGSQLELEYAVVLRNNNEKDYDYGIADNYSDIVDAGVVNEYDKYITRKPQANYYYYGNSEGLTEMKATIEIVDYLSKEVVPGESAIWTEKPLDDLKAQGFISEGTYKTLDKGQSYKIITTADSDGKITLARGEFSDMLTMSASKLLAIKDENIYDNHVEIIKIDGKSARTISKSEDGQQIEKSYKPGDYVPSLDSNNTQQDDDKVSVILTNATGITNYMTTYLIVGLVGLIVLVVGVIFIKKFLIK